MVTESGMVEIIFRFWSEKKEAARLNLAVKKHPHYPRVPISRKHCIFSNYTTVIKVIPSCTDLPGKEADATIPAISTGQGVTADMCDATPRDRSVACSCFMRKEKVHRMTSFMSVYIKKR